MDTCITCTDSSTSDDTKVHNEFDHAVDGSRTCFLLADRGDVFSPLTPHTPCLYHTQHLNQAEHAMTITAEQADQAKGIILDCLNIHHQNRVPFSQVWTKPTHDFDDVPFLDVWVIYAGEPQHLDTALLNSFDTYLMEALSNVGIRAIPSISYVPQSEADQLGAPWTG